MKKILIVVDMQNGFTSYKQTKELKNKVIDLVNTKTFDYVIATKFINKEDSQFVKILNWNRLKNSPETDLIDGLNANYVFSKNIYTCCNKEFLDLLKTVNDNAIPTHVFICGADTECCVLKIATDLFENNIMPLVLVNYCDSNGGKEAHDAGLKVLLRMTGKDSLVNEKITSKKQLDKIIEDRKY